MQAGPARLWDPEESRQRDAWTAERRDSHTSPPGMEGARVALAAAIRERGTGRSTEGSVPVLYSYHLPRQNKDVSLPWPPRYTRVAGNTHNTRSNYTGSCHSTAHRHHGHAPATRKNGVQDPLGRRRRQVWRGAHLGPHGQCGSRRALRRRQHWWFVRPSFPVREETDTY